ncbi:hypothetical protein E7T09_03425 [Deinococcus sp. KSM4-11]|uniref:hypothetical protein n=1 Tax=Deinococcus sp. KSM4-11 TaxID=2568654 RepID=UPI0010A2BF00|nr:hypothetical protein [Deinococcus sp. KSM4-11]THF88270.1 hypothetical protein E7T09_03425 [Deinococcus sp. KSM4-11]
MRFRSLLLASAAVTATTAGATTWLGADVGTSGFGVHAGFSLLRIPIIGAIGVEGSAEKAWNTSLANRYAAGVTLRDLNIPITKVDAFATVGAEYSNAFALYGEGGLRGPLLGPAGWRAFVRASTAGHYGAGVGLELRF